MVSKNGAVLLNKDLFEKRNHIDREVQDTHFNL